MGEIWFNGHIYTLQAEGHKVEALFTKGDKIVDLGSKDELERKYHHEIVEQHDLEGATLLPGFVDSHMHLIGHGEKLMKLDLASYTSKSDLLLAVGEYAKKIAEGEWIIGEGWNENLWDVSEPITRFDIDQVVQNRPVILKRVCRHVISASSDAMRLAGITEDTVSPLGGVIDRDKNGAVNGLFKEQAQELILKAIPQATEEYLRNAMSLAIKDAHKLGLTGGHTEDLNYYGGFERTYNTFRRVIEEDNIPFRAHLLVHHEVSDDFQTAGGSFQAGNEFIEFGAIKIFADGSLGGRTALLSHPYADDPTTSGLAIYTQEQLNEIVKKARRLNMPIAVHAIGDLAFEMVLNAIEEYPLVGEGRDRLIHAQILRRELIERIKGLPLILDIQPRFLASDFPWVVERVGEDYMGYCYAWKTLLNENLPCAGGSDAPIEPLNPLLGIHAAVTRTNIDDPEKMVYNEKEALTVYEAVCLFTKGSAYAACHEHDRGILKEGYLADFTVLTEDIFKVNPHDIASIGVERTVIGGKIVFSKNKSVV
ncbi:amidohydrolase [Bacillus sp. 31A1R]|uniref:Amidohydrolase n=1 Tax=Robertmurraya mangrovi TaxID=3098077 RepID=A0ABU5IZE5_9BACI|nr:amidohydrolase [Bacillus sp. 31A1R]MDZ5472524.1 amidohydrolase [Bacillus sp. 31A1R]